MNDISMMSAETLLVAYRRHALSPRECMEAVLERVRQFDPLVNCMCGFHADVALQAARESEQRWMRGEPLGLLDGVPVSVKDLIDVQGFPTRYGSLTSPDTLQRSDAPAVSRLRRAGAVLFGKTTTSEYGNKIVTDSPLTGITRNPWDRRVTPGGSSGGSSVAVALGMGPLSLATDGGGSIRVPACWSGVVGFKPTFDLVPTGVAGSWTRLSTLGPIARNVRDAALMLSVASGAHDPFRSESDRPVDYRIGLEDGVAGLRVAYCPGIAGVTVDPMVAASVAQAADVFAALGAHVEQVDVKPLANYLDSRMHAIQWSVFFAQRACAMSETQRAQLDSDVQVLVQSGLQVTAPELAGALRARHLLGVEMAAFFERYDLLVTPVFHCGPLPVPGLPKTLLTAPQQTSWCNQTGLPAASIPCGLPGGLPTGVQIVGRLHADALVLRAARAYESARGAFPAAPLLQGEHAVATEVTP
ncbi:MULTISPECIES: amidase family protein [Burkholderia cepacia complex]|uniref:amidase family protein n=1 Tax=Burkholderia cepacia complex TaxID=87882 RepID=UPI000F5E9756|nr:MULTISPECIES: amidase family protein [Burkholderia cepacia complex]RQT22586.1 amidase [Burkholderia cepacia]